MSLYLVRNGILVPIATRVLPQFAGRVRLDQILFRTRIVGVVRLRVWLILAIADIGLTSPCTIILHMPQGVLKYQTISILNYQHW